MSAARAGRAGSVVFSAVMIAVVVILAGLGAWQLQRAAWKGALLADLDAREDAPALDLREIVGLAEDEARYRRITATGVFQPSLLRVHQVQDGVLGYKAVLPLLLDTGETALVDAGFVAQSMDASPELTVPSGPQSIEGFARFLTVRPSAFTPDNVPEANTWYWWDRAAMAAALDLAADDLSPVSIQVAQAVDGLAVNGAAPAPSPSLPRPHDRHAGYAITWFGLAIVVAGAFLAWLWQRRRRGH